MQLIRIHTITARLRLKTGLRISAGDSEMNIGGVDSPVLKHPLTDMPYIPGSSLKGKMRSLLEWKSGAVAQAKGYPLGFGDLERATNDAQKKSIEAILKLFGISGDAKLDEQQARQIGPTRLSFWDCELDEGWRETVAERIPNFSFTEIKPENSINRITGTSSGLRTFDRVISGAKFGFTLSLKVLGEEEEDFLLSTVKTGLRLIELDSLGGSGSRGYGKVEFIEPQCGKEKFDLPPDPFKP